MNRRRFLRSAVAAAMAAQFEPQALAESVLFTQWITLGEAKALYSSDGEPRLRGELSTLDCGVRFIGVDLAAEPDRSAWSQRRPDGSWIVFAHSEITTEELLGR